MAKPPFDINNFPPKSKLPVSERLAIARGRIARHSPFFGTIVFGFQMVERTHDLDTMAIDESKIYYNPKYVMGLDSKELPFEICHEAMHNVLGHLSRMRGKIHAIANKAADLVLDEILVDSLPSSHFAQPSWCELKRDLTKEGGGTMEGVYEILLKQARERGLEGGIAVVGGRQSDDMRPQGQAQGPVAEAQAQKAKMLLAKALQAQSQAGAGKLGEGLLQLVNDILNPKLPWEVLLRRFFQARVNGAGSRTWARPNRRAASLGYCLPYTRPREGMGRIAIGADWSGSMTEEQRNKIQGELNGIFEDTHPAGVDVLYFHHAVSRVDSFGRGEPLKLREAETGGTAFSPVFARINEFAEMPEVCLMFTDMLCRDYGPKPPYPVIWVVVGNPGYGRDGSLVPPFGEVIEAEGL